MTTSQAGIDLIELAEGFSPRLYLDQGHPCIGYGCDLSNEEAATYEGCVIDRDEGAALLRSRVTPIEDAINHLVTAPLTQNQFDALVDFCYNEGIGAFSRSTLLAKLNSGDTAGAALEFLRWDVAGGIHNEGLEARRKKEQALFLQAPASQS